MREIKFRAWDIFYNKFVYSDDCATENRPHTELETFFAKVAGGKDAGREVPVMQFTGLRDKNGRDIYEGDVLQTCPYGRKGREIWEVVYELRRGCYYSYKARNGITNPLEMAFTKARELEVIGNIYENPGLLL